ncbi:MAG TPA: hypothetical protein V6D05_18225 [Stenomitos sp.]
MVGTQRKALHLGIAVALAASASLVAGCPWLPTDLQVNANLDNPSLAVGTSTRLTVDATALPGRTLRYLAVAERGRIYPDKYTESKVLTYYAPYTSKSPNSGGDLVTGDRITIMVDDGTTTKKEVLTVNLGGTTIAHVQNADTNGYGDIVLVSTDDNGFQISNVRPLKNVNGAQVKGAEPTVSPDGRMIAYVDYSPTSPVSAIRTVDAGGRIQTVVSPSDNTGFNLDPSWSPGSQELAFVSDRGSQRFDVYRVSVGEGNTPTRVTNTAVNERFPAWNPSLASDRVSTMVVSAQMNSMGDSNSGSNVAAWNLYMLNIPDGRYLKQLTDLSDQRDYAFETQWRADGLAIAYTRNGPVMDPRSDSQRYQRIYVQDVTKNAGSGVLLNRSELSASIFECSPSWSQTGNQIAYLKTFSSNLQAAQAQVWRQTVNGLAPSSESPRQWTDFTSAIPALWYDGTMRTPNSGNSFGWH